jgi:hypothetical protein
MVEQNGSCEKRGLSEAVLDRCRTGTSANLTTGAPQLMPSGCHFAPTWVRARGGNARCEGSRAKHLQGLGCLDKLGVAGSSPARPIGNRLATRIPHGWAGETCESGPIVQSGALPGAVPCVPRRRTSHSNPTACGVPRVSTEVEWNPTTHESRSFRAPGHHHDLSIGWDGATVHFREPAIQGSHHLHRASDLKRTRSTRTTSRKVAPN